MDTPITISLIGLVGMLIVALANHRLNLWRERESRRITAGQKFSNSIITELSGLYPIPNEWPANKIAIINILESKFSALQAAVTEFRPHLPFSKKVFFDQAWRMYYLGKEGRKTDIHDYWQYVPNSGEGYIDGKFIKVDNTLAYTDNFKKNIDNLLKFAK